MRKSINISVLVCIAVMIIVSYMTNAPVYEKIGGLTFSTMTEEDRRQTRSSWDAKDIISTFIVLGLILAAYMYFRG